MWKKLLKLRPLALQLTKKEVNSGSSTSFWFDKWSQLGVLINLTGERGCIRLGIPVNATVERVVHTYRRHRHRSSVLMQIEQEILSLQEHGLGQQDDICLWMRENGEFRPGFMTSQTWNLTRTHAPRVPWFNGIWFKEATPKFLSLGLRFTTGYRRVIGCSGGIFKQYLFVGSAMQLLK
ncbi:hypothetical protein Bca101_071115 [Brassica carinata]